MHRALTQMPTGAQQVTKSEANCREDMGSDGTQGNRVHVSTERRQVILAKCE